MIIFKEVFFENFLSFYGKHHFKFEENGIHWITGENLDEGDNVSVGSGKTSFTFLIQYALFGQIEKKLNKKDKIINKEAKKNTSVILTFQADKELYKISRYRQHSDFNNDLKLEIYMDDKWKDITSTSIEFTQQEINKIISISPETFLKIILYSREDDKQFFKLTNSERIKIFENIIQLNKFNKYLKKVKSKLKKQNELIIQLEKDESALNKSVDIYQDNAEEEKLFVDKEKKKIEKKIKELQSLSNISDEDLANFIKVKETYNKSLTEKNDFVKSFNESSYKDDIEEKESQIEKIKNKLDKQNKRLINNIEPKKCKNCGAIQDEEDYNNLINDINKTIKELNSDLKECEEELYDLKDKEKKYQKSKKAFDAKLKELENKVKENKKSLKEFDEIEFLTEEQIAELREVNLKIQINQENLSKLSYNRHFDLIKKVEEEQKKLDLLKEKIKEEKKTKDMLKWWEKALDMKEESSIKAYIINRIIPVFNNVLKHNLDSIFEGNLSITIDSQLNEKILKNGQEYDYFELSSGEKFKVNFCTNFSIFDMTKLNLTSSSLIFFDDVFINIDLPTTVKFLNLIEKKYAKDSAIYLISHDKNVENNITPETKTKIIKQSNRSFVE